jgi:formylglycine-generating enzyme
MTMRKNNLTTTFLVFAILAFSLIAQAEPIALVTVRNVGNTNDDTGYGRVTYQYDMGKYEVTAGQYCEFLNAVAATDTYSLYNSQMSTSSYGCKIRQFGQSGQYTYLVDANGDGNEDSDWANRPVNFVSWGDAVRFANWVHNGKTTGAEDLTTTEDGAYYLNGKTSNADLMTVTRKTGAQWFLPTENEWYKAAYHKNDGVTNHYWNFPTGTDNGPSNASSDPDPGNNANFYQGGFTIGSPYWRTPAGEFENSESPYGTYDQGGNVSEWNESVIVPNSSRGVRGGSYYDEQITLSVTARKNNSPITENAYLGFRVARIPEPNSLILLLCGAIACFAWRRSR